MIEFSGGHGRIPSQIKSGRFQAGELKPTPADQASPLIFGGFQSRPIKVRHHAAQWDVS
jgi:hypothetical protein